MPLNRFAGAAFALLALASLASPALARPYDEIMAEATAAFEAEDFAKAAAALDEAQVQRPYSMFLTRNRVLARVLAGDKARAIAIAADIAERGLVLELPSNAALDALRADPEFAAVAERMKANSAPIVTARPIMRYGVDSLLPEAISKRAERTLIGSVRTGEIFDAAESPRPYARLDGGIFDIEQRKKFVYAAVNNQLAFDGDKTAPFGDVVILDTNTGEVRARANLSDDGAPALIGDIEVSKKGRVYASDSLTPRVIEIADFIPAKPSDAPIIIANPIEDPRFVNVQGIALDEKNKRLFVADYLAGLFVIDTKTGKVRAIDNPRNFHLGGIDGLYLHNGALIGVQNGTTPQRIVRIYLDETASVAEYFEVLEQAAPDWAEPTHGYVAGDEFVYIATSNWPAYDDDGELREGAKLKPLLLMSLPLGPEDIMVGQK